MATGSKGYDPGPQLPNYMKKQMKQAPRPASPASVKAGKTAGKRKAASSSVRSTNGSSARKTGGSSARAPSSASRTKASAAKPQASARKTKKRKKDSVDGVIKALIAIAGVLIVVIVVTWLSGAGGEGVSEDITGFLTGRRTFKEGVRLVGVDVSGLTAEEATGLVKNAAEKKLRSVSITVRAGEKEISLDSVALGMDYSIDKALEEGLEYGRGGEVTDVAGNGAGEFDAEYTWSREAIEIALANVSESMNAPAVEPHAEPILDWASEERFHFIEGVPGQILNIDDTADKIEYALRRRDFGVTVDAVLNAVLPTKTIDEVKAVTQLIASFTTNFRAPRDDEIKQNRKFNIKKAADIINGYAVQPGEQWSFNTVVGPRTYELGWKGANGISGGVEYTIQPGGGICQVSTTLFNALLCANMEIVYRSKHSIPSDYIGKGLDATVDTSGIDFIWRNNTEYPVYLFARVAPVEGSSSNNTMTVYLYGVPLPEGVTYKPRSVVIETTPRTDTVFTEDPSIAAGYQKEIELRHDRFVAEAYLDKYVDGKFKEAIFLHKDTYKGNPAKIAVGTGAPLQFGEVPPVDWQVFGTPPTEPAA